MTLSSLVARFKVGKLTLADLKTRARSFLARAGSFPLLAFAESNSKLAKGVEGIRIRSLSLVPSDTLGFMNFCAHASEGCKAACIYTSGRAAIFRAIPEARLKRALLFALERKTFLARLTDELGNFARDSQRKGYKAACRLNVFSDIPFEKLIDLARFPSIQFYDYTKVPSRARAFLSGQFPQNYHLTFSLSEDNREVARSFLAQGMTLAVPFDVKRGQPLPSRFMGALVVDADKRDHRYLDPPGSIAGLRVKGRGKRDLSGFIVPMNDPDIG